MLDRVTPPSSALSIVFALLLAWAPGGYAAESDDATTTLDGEEARALFARLKTLAGRWQARSSRGWSDQVSYEVVARGSVLAGTTRFADVPASTMHTMFYLDGDRLLLTHFCEAGNQPRLVASALAQGGAEITFTFLDASNLPSRDHGHMDQAVIRLLDDDRFSSRWTWYQDGEARWLEEIVYQRLTAVDHDER